MKNEPKKGEIVIYQTPDKKVKIDVSLKNETIWLTQNQIAKLFGSERSVITKHIRNILKDGELNENSACAIFAHTAADGKTYQTKFYNLDLIISVGYRVNSKRATQFRVWATNTLKNYLVKGYAVDEKRLLETQSKFEELKEAVEFLQKKAGHELVAGQEKEILNLLADYSKTLTLLEQYDTEKVILSKQGK